MTPAEAREIDRLEFEAERAAIRQRAYELAGIEPRKPAVRMPQPKPDTEPKRVRRHGRPARRFTVHGQTRTLNEWAAMLGLTNIALQARLRKGWTIEQAVTVPKGRQRAEDTVH